MSKYIDADKLKAAIEEKGLDCSFALKMERLDTLALIDELQQEQPEVDIEKEFQEYWYLHQYDHRLRRQVVDGYGKGVLRSVANHFYELGLNARKEE